MPEIDDIDAPSILGITDQQLNILKSVYKIVSKNKVATPREIELTYSHDFGGTIQKSNLFRQLKILLDKDFLSREGEANYQIAYDNIKKTLQKRQQQYHKKLQHYDQLTNQLEDYFKKTTTQPEKPIVEYLDYNEVFNRITRLLQTSKAYYTVSKFPNIAYSYTLAQSMGIDTYVDIERDRCLKEKELSIKYLSSLSIEYPYEQFMRKHDKHDLAIKECESIIDNLESMISLHENLKVMYSDFPYGMDILLTEGEILRDYFMFIRNERQMAIGGVYIRSIETAKRAKEEFMKNCSIATDISGPRKNKIFKKMRDDLKGLSSRGKSSGKSTKMRK
ncbi:MAG: hypothetical protein GF416_07800 [Candidatus Altiarchaeales archaeon]|nr:hypothetical protein [Candidatus Altiarchaeales archaeon]MBD3417016.1 hypothetical protein [Candidatus Altiarchaeales archaeon]